MSSDVTREDFTELLPEDCNDMGLRKKSFFFKMPKLKFKLEALA